MFILRVVGLVCCFALTAWFVYAPLFQLTANANMFWVSIAAASVLLLLGLLSKKKPHAYDESSFYPDIDPSTAGGRAAGRDVHGFTFTVYLFSHIIYSTAWQLRKAIAHFGSWRLVQSIDSAELGALMSELRFGPGHRRFHKVSTVSTSPELLAHTVALEIVLQQQEDGEILVGLNSDYD